MPMWYQIKSFLEVYDANVLRRVTCGSYAENRIPNRRFNGKVGTKDTDCAGEIERAQYRKLIQTIQYALYIGCA